MAASARSSWVTIDSAALRHNLHRVKQLAPASKVMPVVKGDAYGHGVATVLAACEEADAFAVAMPGEAQQLRELGCDKAVIVFHGFADAEELALVAHYDLQPTVHTPEQLALLDNYSGDPLTVWLKLDTGMHRLGVSLVDVPVYLDRLRAMPQVARVHVISHFANADDPNNNININQIQNFLNVKNNIVTDPGSAFSLANSAAICALPASHLDWVRPGIMLYGASPLQSASAAGLDLRAAMTFSSRLLSLRHCQAGDAIGYGSSWQCPEDMPVGIVAAGYADGYPRHAGPGTPVLVNGQRTRLIGRVSMDSLYVDLRGIDAAAGAEVELWGARLAVDEVARHAGTIAYELLCQAGNAHCCMVVPAAGGAKPAGGG